MHITVTRFCRNELVMLSWNTVEPRDGLGIDYVETHDGAGVLLWLFRLRRLY